jgi:hypothetical protein
MPYTIRKVANKNCYKVMNRKTKRVFSKCTTKEKAKKQLRLLNAIEYNKNFVPRGSRIKRRTYKK